MSKQDGLAGLAFESWLRERVLCLKHQLILAEKQNIPAMLTSALHSYDEALLIWCVFKHGDTSNSFMEKENLILTEEVRRSRPC